MKDYHTTDSVATFGIDIASRVHACDTSDGENSFTFNNNRTGFQKLLKRIRKAGIERVVMEATGGYETDLVIFLQSQNISVCVCNPRQVRDFAKSQGMLEKNDAIDARMIARYGEVSAPKNAPILSKNDYLRLELNARRSQLVKNGRNESKGKSAKQGNP